MKSSKVEFTLDGGPGLLFKTHDRINGQVLFTPHQETNMEDLRIALVGMTRTEVENMNTHLPLSSPLLRKTFLRMELPIHELSWETDILSSGKIHRIPFQFVVPEELPIQACHHQCANQQIRQQHLQLPASLSYYKKPRGLPDMSPGMAEVSYGINFEIWQGSEKTEKTTKIHTSTFPVQIVPIRHEHAPILVPDNSLSYQLESNKTLSRGIMQRTVGNLIASSAQPSAIQIYSPQPQNGEASTSLKIHLRYISTKEGELPPKFLDAQFQLRASTFFGLDPWEEYPDLSDCSTWSRQGYWSECVSLSLDQNFNVQWETSQEQHGTFEASIEARVSLPSHRSYPPTFHSCFVSRTYALKARLFYRVHGKNRGRQSISLSVPVEICVF